MLSRGAKIRFSFGSGDDSHGRKKLRRSSDESEANDSRAEAILSPFSTAKLSNYEWRVKVFNSSVENRVENARS